MVAVASLQPNNGSAAADVGASTAGTYAGRKTGAGKRDEREQDAPTGRNIIALRQ